MNKLDGALIGCGFFAINHMHAWRDIEGVDIVAICDLDAERLDLVGDQFNIARRYRDPRDLFSDSDLDFVDIATTASSHLSLVELAAQHKIAIICQKPFATDIQTAKQMVVAASRANVPLMVHENFRWQSPIQSIKKILQSGDIGEPFWGRFSFRSAYNVYSGQPYLAEGERFIIEDLGIHTLDIARFLMGDVSALTARTMRVNPNIKGEDVATILLDHENGNSTIVDCSYATKLSKEPFPQTLVEIDGNLGTIRLRQDYQLEIVNEGASRTVDVAPTLLPWAEKPWHNIQESVLAIQQHWKNSLVNGTEPETSGADNLKTLALVEAAYASAATKACVAIETILV